MGTLVDLSGRRFGRLSVQSRAPSSPRKVRWLCKCDCGREMAVFAYALKSGHTTSCGCFKRENAVRVGSRPKKHGLSKTDSAFPPWLAMRSRCRNPNATGYDRYGGRGIRVCDRWDDFAAFLADMGPRPSEEHSIDRMDPDGDYEPGNCRWATAEEQANNRRDNVRVEIGGVSTTLKRAMRQMRPAVGESSVIRRMARGWTAEQAMTVPPGGHP